MGTTSSNVTNTLDMQAIRTEFPLLSRQVHGKPLVFLDSAASAQKPQAVIDAECHCYEAEYANIHRGVYYLSQSLGVKLFHRLMPLAWIAEVVPQTIMN